MMSYKLTICIPTYNRSNCLPTALDSVLSQITDRVEIAICDNGSIDNTPEIVASYIQKHPFIKYFRFEKNVGPDRCFIKAAEISTGEYFWFLGDDDAIEPGSLQAVLDALDRTTDLSGISVNRKIFDPTLTIEYPYELISPALRDTRLYVESEPCIRDLFIYFGFMSGQVCRKELWEQAIHTTPNVEQYYNAYSILFLCSKMVLMKPKWLYLHSAYVKYRAHNDSFAAQLGLYKRFLLDVEEYENLASGLFKSVDSLYRFCLNQVCKIHINARIIDLKASRSVQLFSFKALKAMLPRYWRVSAFWCSSLPLLLLPSISVSFARSVYRKLRHLRPAKSS
ncbi:MAG: glycosyltransferase family 2 protein [Verrucomicrobia bacterium]|nr:glycosyltransferase family 2 protein [Verrucomicrobiota bacterium]